MSEEARKAVSSIDVGDNSLDGHSVYGAKGCWRCLIVHHVKGCCWSIVDF